MALNSSELASLPALAPPAGITPDFNSPDSLFAVGIVAASVCAIIVTLSVFSKLATKIWIIPEAKLGWEDYLILSAWVVYLGFYAGTIAIAFKGDGKHQWDLYYPQLVEILKIFYFLTIFYAITNCIIKLSILIQLQKIFSPFKRSLLHTIIYILAVVNTLFYTSLIIADCFFCKPIAKTWNPLLPGHCINFNISVITGASGNFLLDIILFILPLYVVWRLQMPLKKKLEVAGIFAIAILACVSSAIRLYYSVRLSQSLDQTWYNVPVGLWSHAELTFGFIVNCLPYMPRFFQYIKSKLPFTKTFGGSYLRTYSSEERDVSPEHRGKQTSVRSEGRVNYSHGV